MNRIWLEAMKAFDSGIAVFEGIDDVANQALLNCNYGRLMRLIAQTYTNVTLKGNRQEFTAKEREFYNKVYLFRHSTFISLMLFSCVSNRVV